MKDTTARRLSALHRILYRTTRGIVGKRLVSNDMLLLTTTGRHSGKPHTVPLLCLEDEEGSRYVIASWGGRPQHPEWYLNLLVNNRVEIQIDGERYAATATPLPEPDRSSWWDTAVAAYDGYIAYQARTERVIPIVRLAG